MMKKHDTIDLHQVIPKVTMARLGRLPLFALCKQLGLTILPIILYAPFPWRRPTRYSLQCFPYRRLIAALLWSRCGLKSVHKQLFNAATLAVIKILSMPKLEVSISCL